MVLSWCGKLCVERGLMRRRGRVRDGMRASSGAGTESCAPGGVAGRTCGYGGGDDPQHGLSVNADTVSASPPCNAACRAGFWPQPRWQHASHHALINSRRINPRSTHGFPHRDSTQLHRRHLAQRTLKLPHRSPHRRHNHHILHHTSPRHTAITYRETERASIRRAASLSHSHIGITHLALQIRLSFFDPQQHDDLKKISKHIRFFLTVNFRKPTPSLAAMKHVAVSRSNH